MGAFLAHGQSRGYVYEWPTKQSSSSVLASSASVSTSLNSWHCRLGHPSSTILHQLVSSQSRPLLSKSMSLSHCDACLCNKSHKQPFGVSTLSCSQPLEILICDVWGPAPLLSFDKFHYYIVFVNYFTKYTWLYPLKNKSDVPSIFIQFKSIVKKFFNSTIKTVYTDGSGEATSLGHLLSRYGIQHDAWL